MSKTSDSERHLWLASRLLDGDLSDREIGELAGLLRESEADRRDFVRLAELDAMLGEEETVADRLSERTCPDNVVALPGSGQVVVDDMPARGKNARRKAQGSLWGWAAAAVLLFAGIVGVQPFTDRGEPLAKKPDVSSEAPSEAEGGEVAHRVGAPGASDDPGPRIAPLPELPSADDDPKTRYDRALLANLGTGSQQRPPTNFTAASGGPEDGISFNRDIRPILSENCFSCHGPDEESREAKLRLDLEEGATGGEHPAIVRGAPERSELVHRVTADDPDDLMPPPDSNKTLTTRETELLRRWIAEGAPWEGHWSFQPPVDRLPGEVPDGKAIDWFLEQRRAEVGLHAAPEADRRTLIRRASLDLTGLPPTPEEVESFLADEEPGAWERLVDGLLERPAFGEHRARYWLDAARYGDTHGLHLDNYREIWPYRDWVVDAYNRNQPFDQFTIEQVAGDLLPGATQEQRVATGFNRCNVTTSEGGSIEEEILVRYAVDRVSTTSTVWLGLTTGCAQCHDHKFDPITSQDFYQLFAFFNNTTQPGMDGNAKDSPPFLRVFDSPAEEKRFQALQKKVATAKKEAEALIGKFEPGNATVAELTPAMAKSEADRKTPADLGKTGDFSVDRPFTLAFRYQLPEEPGPSVLLSHLDGKGRGWRVVVEDQGLVLHLVESWPNRVLKRGTTRRFKPGAKGHFAITYDGSGRSDGITLHHNGKEMLSRFINQWRDTLVDDFDAPEARLLAGGLQDGSAGIPGLDEIALFDRRLTETEILALAERHSLPGIEKKPREKRSDKEKERLRRFLAAFGEGSYREKLEELSELETRLSQLRSRNPVTLVMAEKDEGTPTAHMLHRGEYDQKGEKVEADFPAFLPGFGEDLSRDRLGLARWLVHRDNPLTARVIVNRAWQELFGTGLVKTAEDFGAQGENPSHPGLLDWLALRFVDSGWDVKKLYRDLMMTRAYRQSSRVDPGSLARDPHNRLLARGPRFRLDAEVIRDQALAASGLLDTAVGGPPVKPYQPSGIWQTVGYTNSNTQTFSQDYGPAAEHRRSLYTFLKRTAPSPNMAIFDAPNRESCTVRRERTNTPLQALVGMNDPQFVRAARHLAHRVLREESDRAARLDRLALLLRARPLDEEEKTIAINSLDQFLNTYGSDPEAARDLLVDRVNPAFSLATDRPEENVRRAAWTMVASQMINLDEVLNKN